MHVLVGGKLCSDVGSAPSEDDDKAARDGYNRHIAPAAATPAAGPGMLIVQASPGRPRATVASPDREATSRSIFEIALLQ